MMILKNDPRPYFNCQYSVSRSVSSAVGVKELSYNCTVFTDFQHTTLSPFQTFSLSYCIWAINDVSCWKTSSVGGFIVACISPSMILCCWKTSSVGGFIVGCISPSMILCCWKTSSVGGFIVGCISPSMILCCWKTSSVGGFIVGCSSCCVMNWGVAIGGFIVGCMNGGWMGVSLVGLGVFFRDLLHRFWNQHWDWK